MLNLTCNNVQNRAVSKKRKFYLWRDALICSLTSVFVAILLLTFFINIKFLDPFEKAIEDFRFTDIYTSQNFIEKKPTHKIIIVNIGNHDREDIAIAINKIAQNKAKVIGLDIIFKDKKDSIMDAVLQQALQNNKNIVSAYIIEENKIISSDPYFRTDALGFINLNQQDAVVRDFTGIKKSENQIDYAFPIKISEMAGLLNENTKEKLERVQSINYTANQNSFLTFDLDEIIYADTIPAIENSIVLFGYLGVPTGNVNDIEDKHFTPLNPKYAGKSIPDMFGILIHANIIKMLMEDNFMYKVPKAMVYCIAFLCCFMCIYFSLIMHKKKSTLYDFILKFYGLALTIVLVYFSFVLFKWNVDIQIETVIILSLLGLEIVALYEHSLNYLKKRWKWKSYLLK